MKKYILSHLPQSLESYMKDFFVPKCYSPFLTVVATTTYQHASLRFVFILINFSFNCEFNPYFIHRCTFGKIKSTGQN